MLCTCYSERYVLRIAYFHATLLFLLYAILYIVHSMTLDECSCLNTWMMYNNVRYYYNCQTVDLYHRD